MKNKNSKIPLDLNTYGVACGIGAYTLWGLLPIYWKLLKEVPAYEILGHRIIWSFVVAVILVEFKRKSDKLRAILSHRRTMGTITKCTILVSMNWCIYIWAVNSNHIIDASLGYFITPFVSVILGMVVLKERLQKMQYVALAIACIGVLIKIAVFGELPWISGALALTFGFYGLYKKTLQVESSVGFAVETLIATPFALGYLVIIGTKGAGSMMGFTYVSLLLILTGIVTATPLLLFAEAARNVKLTTIGFLQYISPSISLLLGILVYKESFSHADYFSFGLIWAALGLYSYSVIKLNKKGVEQLEK